MRPFVVSNEAYIEERQWLQTGWLIWNEKSFKRDNFLLLPSTDYTDFSSKGAEPQDRAARCFEVPGDPVDRLG